VVRVVRGVAFAVRTIAMLLPPITRVWRNLAGIRNQFAAEVVLSRSKMAGITALLTAEKVVPDMASVVRLLICETDRTVWKMLLGSC